MTSKFAPAMCAANMPAVRRCSRLTLDILGLLLVLGFTFLFPALRAQVYSGSMTGVVKDPSGGVVPGARAMLTDEEKGFTYRTVTDTEGRYVLRNLPPGRYGLSVSAPGMRTHTQSAV